MGSHEQLLADLRVVAASDAADLRRFVTAKHFACVSPAEWCDILAQRPAESRNAADWEQLARAALAATKRKQALEALKRVEPVAADHGATPGQLAVAWVNAQPGVTASIVGARDRRQAEMNARAAALEPDHIPPV